MNGQRTIGFGSPAGVHAEKGQGWNSLLFSEPHAMYPYRVKGDGLKKLGIRHSDTVIIDCSMDALPGDLIAAVIEGKFCIGLKEQGPSICCGETVIPLSEENRILGVVSRLVRFWR